MPPKGAGSWPLAGGRNSTAACTKGENPNFQLWGAVWLFCPQSLERERTAPSTNRVERLEIRGCFSLQQFPLLLLLPQGQQIHSSRPCPLGSLFILSVFTHLLLMCLQWLPTCQEGTGRMVRKGREMGGQSCKNRGRWYVSCTWRD